VTTRLARHCVFELFAAEAAVGNKEVEAVALFVVEAAVGNKEVEAVVLFVEEVAVGNKEVEVVVLRFRSSSLSSSAIDFQFPTVVARKRL
jgi:hypothetical protein